MTKKDIVLEVSQNLKTSQSKVKSIIQEALNAMVRALERGDKIEIRNFGVFKVKLRKSRLGRNPRKNIPVEVPERKVVVFKPGFYLKRNIK